MAAKAGRMAGVQVAVWMEEASSVMGILAGLAAILEAMVEEVLELG